MTTADREFGIALPWDKEEEIPPVVCGCMDPFFGSTDARCIACGGLLPPEIRRERERRR